MPNKVLAKIFNNAIDIIIDNPDSDLEAFNKLPEYLKQSIVKDIHKAQGETIRKGMINEDDIRLPILGKLAIKDTRRKAVEYIKMILKEYGVERVSELNKEETIVFKDRMSELMRKEILKKKSTKKNIEYFGGSFTFNLDE